MTTTILVLGAGGQVGRALSRQSWPSTMTVRYRDRMALDITDAHGLAEEISAFNVKLVINAAAYTAVDAAESDRESATLINGEAPGILAGLCANHDIPLIHISTDYVFNGEKNTPYKEEDPVDPQSVYGATKWEGEVAIRRALSSHIILRTSWVFSNQPRNFVLTLLRIAREQEVIRIVNDQVGCPTSADSIAHTIVTIAEKILLPGFQNWGTYHYGGNPSVTWHDFAKAILAEIHFIKHSVPLLQGISTKDYPTPACRPAHSILACEKIFHVFGITQPHWHDAMKSIVHHVLNTEKEMENSI